MRRSGVAAFVTVLLLIMPPAICSGERIRALLTGQVDESSNPLIKWFKEEPLLDAHSIPTRPGGIIVDADIKRFIRIYFPRTFEEVKGFDFIMLHSPVMYHFEDTQARWLYDAYREGAGGLSAPACMSSNPDIHNAWISSVLCEAFPNDAPAVIGAGGPQGSESFRIIVNKDFPEPVLTPFIPLGIETFLGAYAYLIKPRPGASTLAWEVGCFPEKVPYIAVWDYEKGRTMTLADSFGLAFWSSYAGRGSRNQYSLDILMNLVLYSIKRDVPTEVLVFHRMRTSFVKFRTKMALLVSLMEFAQRFGANDRRMEKVVAELEGEASVAKNHYMLGEFEECEEIMNSILNEEFREAEAVMMVLKKRAMMWVYMVEWSTVTATLMISSFILWTIMVRKRLYQSVKTTKLR